MSRKLVPVSIYQRDRRWHGTVRARIGESRVVLSGWEETKIALQQWVEFCIHCLELTGA